MTIKEIQIEHFKSIYDSTTFTFNRDGLWKVGGAVGSGKTTLGEAILFCLYGQVKNKTIGDLISWGASRCDATIKMSTSGHDIELHRRVKRQGQGQLDIIIDGEVLEYTDKRSGQQILETEYYDVPRVAVESLCIISFNNFKSIASMGPGSKESRQFIDDVFGFGVVNDYIEQTKIIRDEKKYTLMELQAKKRMIEKDISSLRHKMDELKGINESGESVEMSRRINEINEMLKDSEQTYKGYIFTTTQTYEEANRLCNLLKLQGKQLKNNIDKIKGGVCPVCGGSVSVDKIQEFTDELNSLREKYKEANLNRESVATDLMNYKNELNMIQTKASKEIESLRSAIRDIEIKKKCESEGNESRMNELEEELVIAGKAITSAELELSGWDELYNELYRNSRGTLMRYYVDELNNNINYYLQEMQQPYIIQFTEKFECKISAFGEENIGINTLSTGQEKVVNTAIIFGILKTLLNGINFNIIFLDELTSNMHDDLRDLTCDMIRRNVKGKSIYIISHAPIDEQLFDGEIKVKLYPREEDGRLIQSSVYTTES